jgi:hypothetical protein
MESLSSNGHFLSISLITLFHSVALLQITTFENATTIRINNKYGKLQQCNKSVNSKECGTIVALLRCCQCSGAFYSHRNMTARKGQKIRYCGSNF